MQVAIFEFGESDFGVPKKAENTKGAVRVSMITCFGSSSIDLFVRAARLPAVGETVSGSRFWKAFGGKGANQIAQAALLGARTAFVGRVGTSQDGADIVANLASMGVDVSGVKREENDGSAGVALIEVEDASGANRIVVVPGANAKVKGSDAFLALDKTEYLLLQLEVPMEAVVEVLTRAGPSVVTVLNPSPVPTSDAAMKSLKQVLSRVSYLIVNEYEGEELSGLRVTDVSSAQACCENLQQQGARNVVVTLGEKGAVVRTANGESGHVPSPSVKVVDTTGAGDSFLGAFVHFLAKKNGKDELEAARKACVVASVSVQKEGCQPSYPTWAQIKHLV